MEQTIQALGGVLLKAIPTIILLILVHIYLKVMLFGPLEKTLKQREALTAGARKDAENSLAAAERKQQDYEAKFRDARSEVYKNQEEMRRKWLDDQAALISAAREKSEAAVKAAKDQIATETAEARKGLGETSATMADQIASRVLSGRAA